MSDGCPLPIAEPEVGLKVLKGLARKRSLLTALEIMREEVGPAFQITLPGFQPAVFAGPESVRQIMVSRREHFCWRSPNDPVTKLLRHGLLVEDGEAHLYLRAQMEPALHKTQTLRQIPNMLAYTDRVLDKWADGSTVDMLVEMRKAALLIFTGALLDVEFGPDMERLWRPILRAIKYISPGLWIVWPDMPRFGYREALTRMDDYLYGIIRDRRRKLKSYAPLLPSSDLLTHLVSVPGMSDDLIRDQLLTMLIAGHDTSTALLAWVLHIFAIHPEILNRAQAEVDAVVGRDTISAARVGELVYLDAVIKETLRLYPPIHIGNRIVGEDTAISGYELRAGARVMASIYLTHRDDRFWDSPECFRPERFAPDAERPSAFTYIPFGGGPRSCIGATFAQIEGKVVLARILQQFKLKSAGRAVKPYMGATLEPHPGVFLTVHRRR
jgi:cytochrome P450